MKLLKLFVLVVFTALSLTACGGGGGGGTTTPGGGGGGGGGGGSVPSAPTGVTAVAATNQVKVTISWQPSDTATSYVVYYSTDPNVTKATGTPIPVAASGTGTQSYLQTSGLISGNTYYYLVTAVNANGESAASTLSSGAVTVTVPSAPVGLQATAHDGSVSLSWTGNGADSYKVYNASISPVALTNAVVVNSGTSTTITGLTDGNTYYFVVTAVKGALESVPSGEVSCVPSVTPALPNPTNVLVSTLQGVSIDPAVTAPNQAWVRWSAVPNAVSYNVYRSTASGFSIGSSTKIDTKTTTSSTLNLPTNGDTYYFLVTAVDSQGVESAPSAVGVSLPLVFTDTMVASKVVTYVGGSLADQITFNCAADGTVQYRATINGTTTSGTGAWSVSGPLFTVSTSVALLTFDYQMFQLTNGQPMVAKAQFYYSSQLRDSGTLTIN